MSQNSVQSSTMTSTQNSLSTVLQSSASSWSLTELGCYSNYSFGFGTVIYQQLQTSQQTAQQSITSGSTLNSYLSGV
jgi:hypothetical protein